MDANGDGTVDVLDAQYLQQIESGLRNPDGTPVPQLDPVTAAVNDAVGGGMLPGAKNQRKET